MHRLWELGLGSLLSATRCLRLSGPIASVIDKPRNSSSGALVNASVDLLFQGHREVLLYPAVSLLLDSAFSSDRVGARTRCMASWDM